MNAHSMLEIDNAMEAAADEIATSNVVELMPAGIRAESTLEEHAAFHRRAAAAYRQRAAEERSQLKADMATISAEEKALKAQYEADRAILAARKAERRTEAAERINRYQCLGYGSEANCSEIEKRI